MLVFLCYSTFLHVRLLCLLQTEALIKGWGLGGERNIFHFFMNMYLLIREGSEVIFPDIIYLSTFSVTLECHLPCVTFNTNDHDL